LPPQATEHRASNPIFAAEEELFRRYLSTHLDDGELDPSAIRFDEPPSFLRSAFSIPSDALHINCADGTEVTRFGVLRMQASAAQQSYDTVQRGSFYFGPIHVPLETCYAHSEVHCSHAKDFSEPHVEPPKSVKNAFRVAMAKVLSVAIRAPESH
jgi:hypothetical protein